ncbi:tRNA (guanine(26)-N(2))-dimethyltransferase-like isoform X3 [Macrobrachium nipponense]|uniref:tRNA (guanine(26)-N(2))-dimethyltransferase-like isoform X3 n=1 Tax=Macrobrachium nipponense TaxID=159736 RepID=UPI0030C844B0
MRNLFLTTRYLSLLSPQLWSRSMAMKTNDVLCDAPSVIQKEKTEVNDCGFQIDTTPYTSVSEGKAEVLFPSTHDVFYNPVQEFNRDLSVAVLRQFASEHQDGIRILEGLAASGLRSIRYAREIEGVKEVVANDISKQAIECMKRNIKHNNVEGVVIPSHKDASMLMYENREPSKRFHAIDLDPYGSPHIFLDGAVQCVIDGGILLVTCTDMAVLCGNSPETSYTKYGAVSVKSKACHEIALRIVLQCIESHANRYGRYIVPLLSLSADFYVRVVVRVFTSQAKCKETFSKVSWLYQCVGCETFTLQPLGRILVNGRSVKYQLSHGPSVSQSCTHCGYKHIMAGPMWSAPIHDREFLKNLKESLIEEDFTTYRRMFGTLTMMEEELPDVPLFYVVDKLAAVAGINLCKMVQFRSALLNAGYDVSMSHTCKASIKTNAPAQLIWDIVRAWEKIHPANRAKMKDDRAGKRILEKASEHTISFECHPDANPESRRKELLRFQVKPEKNWGPKSRAKTSLFHTHEEEKRVRNQGKKRKHHNDSHVLEQTSKENKHIVKDTD